MEKLFDITLQSRKNLYQLLENTPKEVLLEIPVGYSNNIWWNIAHVVVTQQLLVYKMSNTAMEVPDELVNKYRKGTTPSINDKVSDKEIKAIGGFLLSTIDKTQEDYKSGFFKEFNVYTTSANVTLTCVEDAIAFNIFHEGLHLGTIKSLQKALKQ